MVIYKNTAGVGSRIC